MCVRVSGEENSLHMCTKTNWNFIYFICLFIGLWNVCMLGMDNDVIQLLSTVCSKKNHFNRISSKSAYFYGNKMILQIIRVSPIVEPDFAAAIITTYCITFSLYLSYMHSKRMGTFVHASDMHIICKTVWLVYISSFVHVRMFAVWISRLCARLLFISSHMRIYVMNQQPVRLSSTVNSVAHAHSSSHTITIHRHPHHPHRSRSVSVHLPLIASEHLFVLGFALTRCWHEPNTSCVSMPFTKSRVVSSVGWVCHWLCVDIAHTIQMYVN